MKTSLERVNPRVRAVSLTPHSVLHTRAQTGQKPFRSLIDVGSGDPQGAGVKPVSFIRQVLAVCLFPDLLDDLRFPEDVRLRAQKLLRACEGQSLGSYTASSGLQHVRQTIAEFIAKRDGGVPADARDIFICSGAQRACTVVAKLLNRGEGRTQTGILTPQPAPATLLPLLEEAGVAAVPYLLTEERGWALELDQLHRALDTSRGRCQTRAIFISNPGNPTGHVQDRKSIQEVIRFAAAEKLLLLVDEVYQDSVYGQSAEFTSYKKVLLEMEPRIKDTVELISVHSLSSGRVAECGLRAGYLEAVNMDPEVKVLVDTALTADISAPAPGQLALDLMLDPPRPGDTSYRTHAQEMLLARSTLSRNARRALRVLNALPGVSCRPAEGGIFLTPRLLTPAEIRAQAETQGLQPDVLYCQMLLEQECLLVGPGEHGGAAAGSFYLRMCILASADVLEDALSRLSAFHLRLTDIRSDTERKTSPDPPHALSSRQPEN